MIQTEPSLGKQHAPCKGPTNGTDHTGSEKLSAAHWSMLHVESGISDEVIASRGCRTITNHKELIDLGFAPGQARAPGLLLPLHTTDGALLECVYRPDSPRVVKGKEVKYELKAGQRVRLDCPPLCRKQLADPKIPLWLTEGQKKADSLASRGACAVAVLGVWNFKGMNEFGGTTWLADWDYIALKKRDVRIVFDNDVMRKPDVRKALDRLIEHLQRKDATVSAVYLPLNGPKGVDEFLASGKTLTDLEALLESPRPQPQAAQPFAELVDDAPVTMRRPLALIDGRAYAAIWPHVKTSVSEALDKSGQVIKVDPPRIETKQRLVIVRDDGRFFGDGGDEPLSGLGIDVHLPEIPPAEKLWSTPAAKAYRSGARPDPVDVFNRVVATVGTFIDFDRSLTDEQNTMCEMIACYIVSTYFLDAFTVVGFLWPNGERGSGKTQLLLIVTELAYLGQTILAGGSFASLRDLADYGACLAFDDAENLSDPKRTDPDKRTLLLAGNRKGNTVPLKEPGPDRTWKTRYVNTFCPRLFSAIRLPDATLGSRSIIVPLIRTIDRAKANADPLNYKLWPHDRRILNDDLWALGLAHLPTFEWYETLVNEQSSLAGRTLEPWRAILATAKWLDEMGVKELFARMSVLSEQYQQERPALESGDLTALTIRALCQITIGTMPEDSAVSAISAVSAVSNIDSLKWVFTTKDLTEVSRNIVTESELDITAETINSRRIGRSLAKMRLKQAKREKKSDPRQWSITLSDLLHWVERYVLQECLPSPTNGGNGGNGANGGDETKESKTAETSNEANNSPPDYTHGTHSPHTNGTDGYILFPTSETSETSETSDLCADASDSEDYDL